MAEEYSIVQYYSAHGKSSCGYCSGRDTNYSHGMHAYTLTVQDYQDLIDRGWRRSGTFCYKPTNDKTCCPMYTIKCEATNFKISKSQRKILKKVGKFLRHELSKDETMEINFEERNTIDIGMSDSTRYRKYSEKMQDHPSFNVPLVHDDSSARSSKIVNVPTSDSACKRSQKTEQNLEASTSNLNSPSRDRKTKPAMPNSAAAKGPCRKAKLIRIERKRNKLLAQGKSLEEIEAIYRERKKGNRAKSFEELFEEALTGTQNLEMKLVRVMSEGFKSTFSESAALYKKYQMTVHRDPANKCSEKAFFNFLVSSPLQHLKSDDGPPCGYGSFHEQYWLDNKLIAVGVIDILPLCVSSVYFFYDPDYSFLTLGTFSSLREVYLTRQLNRVANSLRYYYMGFYIHSCQKMRYKARLRPSRLLCPETYTWFDIEHCIKLLNKQKYCRFNPDIDAIDQNGIVDIGKVLILHSSMAMPYSVYKAQTNRAVSMEDEEEIEEYARYVGSKCATRMLFYRVMLSP